MTKTLFVTQPWLPPLEEFTPYLDQIWKSKVLTNGGPFHRQLEEALAEQLSELSDNDLIAFQMIYDRLHASACARPWPVRPGLNLPRSGRKGGSRPGEARGSGVARPLHGPAVAPMAPNATTPFPRCSPPCEAAQKH